MSEFINECLSVCLSNCCFSLSLSFIVELRQCANKKTTNGLKFKNSDSSRRALLSLEDESFLQGTSPLEFSGTPALQSAAYVLGFPEGAIVS